MTCIHKYSRFYSALILAALLVTGAMTSCTKHYAAAATTTPTDKKSEPVAIAPPARLDTVAGGTLRDSLVGTWKLRTAELDNAVNLLSSYGSQVQRDQMLDKQKQFQQELKGLVVTFKGDNTYVSGYGGQTDSGTWRVTRTRALDTMSQSGSTPSSYQVRSVSASTLVVLLDANDLKLLITLDRQ